MDLVLLLAEIFTVASAVIVAFHPNILYASVFLLFAFCGVAVMFLFAGADFLAVVSYVWDHPNGEVVAVQKLAEK